MYCVVWKRDDSDKHELFTNVLEYDYKYFDGVKLDGNK